jgi:hypothetical protein
MGKKSASFSSPQQVDARGSTFNDVKGNQFNDVQIVISNNYSSDNGNVELNVRQSMFSWFSLLIQTRLFQDDLNIDPELNKYPPLVAYGLDVVMNTTRLVMTNIAAAATHLGLPTLSDSVTSAFESLIVTK